MKQHFQKIGEGFQGISKDLFSYSKKGFKNLYSKNKNYFQKVDKFLGKTGWFLIIAIIIFWSLLSYYSKIINRTNHYRIQNYLAPNIDIIKEHQSIKNKRNKTINFLLKPKQTHYQQYQHFFSSSDDIEYNIYIENNKLYGYIISIDSKKLSSFSKKIKKIGLKTNINGEKLEFIGDIKYYQDLILILNN